MRTFIGLSITAAVLGAVLVVSCAPVASDTPKGEAPLSALSAQSSPSPELQTEKAALDGDWVCISSPSCAYMSISISAEDGVAVLNGSTQESATLSLKIDSSASAILLNMSIVGMSDANSKITGRLALANGGANAKSGQNELVIGQDTYSRRTVPAAPANAKN